MCCDQIPVIAKHLTLRRNCISHGHRIDIDDEEIMVFQMLEFVRAIFAAYIRNPFKADNLEEFWECCDLLTDADGIQKENAKLDLRRALLKNVEIAVAR